MTLQSVSTFNAFVVDAQRALRPVVVGCIVDEDARHCSIDVELVSLLGFKTKEDSVDIQLAMSRNSQYTTTLYYITTIPKQYKVSLLVSRVAYDSFHRMGLFRTAACSYELRGACEDLPNERLTTEDQSVIGVTELVLECNGIQKRVWVCVDREINTSHVNAERFKEIWNCSGEEASLNVSAHPKGNSCEISVKLLPGLKIDMRRRKNDDSIVTESIVEFDFIICERHIRSVLDILQKAVAGTSVFDVKMTSNPLKFGPTVLEIPRNLLSVLDTEDYITLLKKFSGFNGNVPTMSLSFNVSVLTAEYLVLDVLRKSMDSIRVIEDTTLFTTEDLLDLSLVS